MEVLLLWSRLTGHMVGTYWGAAKMFHDVFLREELGASMTFIGTYQRLFIICVFSP